MLRARKKKEKQTTEFTSVTYVWSWLRGLKELQISWTRRLNAMTEFSKFRFYQACKHFSLENYSFHFASTFNCSFFTHLSPAAHKN